MFFYLNYNLLVVVCPLWSVSHQSKKKNLINKKNHQNEFKLVFYFALYCVDLCIRQIWKYRNTVWLARNWRYLLVFRNACSQVDVNFHNRKAISFLHLLSWSCRSLFHCVASLCKSSGIKCFYTPENNFYFIHYTYTICGRAFLPVCMFSIWLKYFV